MSSRIYFKNNRTRARRYIVRALSDTYRFLRPQHAKHRLRKLMLTPQSRQPAATPEAIQQDFIDTPYGKLCRYSVGSGPVILFVHGWSGSGSQFFELMQTVAQQGYCAVSFDGYLHGHSGGVENNYPLFVRGIESISETLAPESLHCVVSHSMGCAASLYAFKQQSLPHFLIAPLFNFYGELHKRITEFGIANDFFEDIVATIEAEHGISVRTADPVANIDAVSHPITIVHSKNDSFALYQYTEEAVKRYPHIQLQTISDIGHMKIVGAEETRTALLGFLQKTAAAIPAKTEAL